jgi:hypothetical protein
VCSFLAFFAIFCLLGGAPCSFLLWDCRSCVFGRGDRGLKDCGYWGSRRPFLSFSACTRGDTTVVTQRADANRVLDRVPVPARGRAYPSTSAPARVGIPLRPSGHAWLA